MTYTLGTLYLVGLFVLCIAATFVYLLAHIRKDNSIIDRYYGLLVIKVSAVYFFVHTLISPLCFGETIQASCFSPHRPSLYFLLMMVMVIFWGVRLSLRIHLKNKGKGEDFRYAAWRKDWLHRGRLYFQVRSYLQIFLLQSFVISIVSLPLLIAATPQTSLGGVLPQIGIFVWFVGFIFESVGDYQLDRFIKYKHKVGSVLTTGLWAISRHPNYFGEILMWVGLSIMTLFRYDYSVLAILSPALIAYLLMYVSGVPLVEKRFEGNAEWNEYKAKTPAIFPRI